MPKECLFYTSFGPHGHIKGGAAPTISSGLIIDHFARPSPSAAQVHHG